MSLAEEVAALKHIKSFHETAGKDFDTRIRIYTGDVEHCEDGAYIQSGYTIVFDLEGFDNRWGSYTKIWSTLLDPDNIQGYRSETGCYGEAVNLPRREKTMMELVTRRDMRNKVPYRVLRESITFDEE